MEQCDQHVGQRSRAAFHGRVVSYALKTTPAARTSRGLLGVRYYGLKVRKGRRLALRMEP
jgi:hypothetical protein